MVYRSAYPIAHPPANPPQQSSDPFSQIPSIGPLLQFSGGFGGCAIDVFFDC
jgi:hypothetical protein